MRTLMALQMLFMSVVSYADSVTINDIVWHYETNGDVCTLVDSTSSRVQPACVPGLSVDRITVPKEIGNMDVTSIGPGAFQLGKIGNCRQIVVPSCVTNISAGAFLGKFWSEAGFNTTASLYYCWDGEVLFEGNCPIVQHEWVYLWSNTRIISDRYFWNNGDSYSYIGFCRIDGPSCYYIEPFSKMKCYVAEDACGWDTNKLWYGAQVVVGAIRPRIKVDEDDSRFVWLETSKSGAEIYYTLDGTAATTNSIRYFQPLKLSGPTCVRAVAKVDGYPFQIEAKQYCVPSPPFRIDEPIIKADSEMFETASHSISLICEVEDATIYYTIDGSEPSAANGRVYTGPFNIYQTTTVKAIAVKDDWKDSAVATATFTKSNTLGPAMNLLEMLPDNDASHPWTVVTDVTHDGVSAVRSGAITHEQSTTLKTVVYGAGRLSFWWKTACEPSVDGEYYDYATFYNGSTAVTNLAGVTDWQQVMLRVDGTGKHTFKWTYQKDDSGTTPSDCVWVDQVQWLPDTTDYYSDHTLTTETPVPYAWLEHYGYGTKTDYESAANSTLGKRDSNKRLLRVEDDYVAGTDPTNITSVFTTYISTENGFPEITWWPDLNEGGTKSLRNYKIWGRESLDSDSEWEYPTNSLHRFFKVSVEMP